MNECFAELKSKPEEKSIDLFLERLDFLQNRLGLILQNEREKKKDKEKTAMREIKAMILEVKALKAPVVAPALRSYNANNPVSLFKSNPMEKSKMTDRSGLVNRKGT